MNELIEALKADTEAKAQLTKAIAEQTDVISQLVNAVALLIDKGMEPEQDDGEPGAPMYLMDGTRIS